MNMDGSERFHALDMVRGTALLLGIFFHASIAYLPSSEPVWFMGDASRSPLVSVFYFVSHSFRLTTFFLIAGFFGRMQFHRLGAGGFLKDRLKRLGIPLIVGWILMQPLLIGVLIWSVAAQNGGSIPDDLPPPPPFTWATFPFTHLWFLYVLLLFCFALIIFRALIVAIDRREILREWLDRLVAFLFKTPLALIVLSMPAAFALLYYDAMWMWFGDADTGPRVHSYSSSSRRVWHGIFHRLGASSPARRFILSEAFLGLLYGVVAVGLTAWCLSQVGLVASYGTMEFGMKKALYVSAYALTGWAWTFAFIGGSFVFFSGHSSARRYLADSSYWLYIIHLPIVIALQTVVLPYDWSWVVKFSIVIGVSVALMLASYHLFVRYSFIGAILNGKRRVKDQAGLLQGSGK